MFREGQNIHLLNRVEIELIFFKMYMANTNAIAICWEVLSSNFAPIFFHLNDCYNQQQHSKPCYEKTSKIISTETCFYDYSS